MTTGMTESTPPSIADAAKPRAPREPGLWGGWLTLAWGVGGFVVLLVTQTAASR